jgi:hypothetical protein
VPAAVLPLALPLGIAVLTAAAYPGARYRDTAADQAPAPAVPPPVSRK